MLQIAEQSIRVHQLAARDRLSAEITRRMPSLGSTALVRRYVDEALDAGVESDRDIAEYAMLMIPADRDGRREDIQARVADQGVRGALKVFQIRHALYGPEP